ncbi:hypothetical protein IPJ91_03450 [bacterium]|nr:MAG: hypothetical protein IPJ91_03450 [bacterium]
MKNSLNKSIAFVLLVTITILTGLILYNLLGPSLDNRTSAKVDDNIQKVMDAYNSKKSSYYANSEKENESEILETDYKAVCWNNVLSEEGKFYWKNECRGRVYDVASACSTAQNNKPELTLGEAFGYLSWMADELPLNTACQE